MIDTVCLAPSSGWVRVFYILWEVFSTRESTLGLTGWTSSYYHSENSLKQPSINLFSEQIGLLTEPLQLFYKHLGHSFFNSFIQSVSQLSFSSQSPKHHYTEAARALDKGVKLVNGEFVINGATPSCFFFTWIVCTKNCNLLYIIMQSVGVFFVCVSVCLFVCYSVCLCVCLSVCQ